MFESVVPCLISCRRFVVLVRFVVFWFDSAWWVDLVQLGFGLGLVSVWSGQK